MPFFQHGGLRFYYEERGDGVPVVFQHGLGGDVGQPIGIFKPPPGFRLLAMDCRAHGETHPLGDPNKISLNCFADDLLEFLDRLELAKAVVGGISMGAAVALNFTLRYPERVIGLILSRPAWLDKPMEQNVEIYALIAKLIRGFGPAHGLQRFKESSQHFTILRQSPDSANSLVGQFENPRAQEAVLRLEKIPTDAPNWDRREWTLIRVPTLVLASRQDPIHPFEYGEVLAQAIPGAELRELTPKSVSKDLHVKDVQEFLEDFLIRHFSRNSGV
jgi:pimeloyl-ACP methyl ester carboxylesterase